MQLKIQLLNNKLQLGWWALSIRKQAALASRWKQFSLISIFNLEKVTLLLFMAFYHCLPRFRFALSGYRFFDEKG